MQEENKKSCMTIFNEDGKMDAADNTELKIKNLAEDISEIKTELKTLPETITKSLTETVNLKIDLATKEIEMKFYKYISALSLGLLSTAGGLIIKYIMDGTK